MSLLGRAYASRQLYAAVSYSRKQQGSLRPVLAGYSHAGGVGVSRSLAAMAGGKSVSESTRQGSEEAKRTWSAWEVAAFSCLAGGASLGMIAYPRVVQNEPSVEAPPMPGLHSVTFVQRTPNRMQHLVLENQKTAEESPLREQVDTKPRQLVADGGTKRPYDISVRAIKGNRVTMEDEYFVTDGGRFAAVFDGHGGGGVSTWLRNQLYGHMRRYLKEAHWEQQHDEKDSRKPSVSAHVSAIRKAFNQVESDVVAQDTLAYQGSTAVAVVMHESDDGHRTLISANVGDSRAILSRRGKAIDLTRDHKPNEEREKARILKMGETIEWDSLSKVHRVRNLSLSRAIGDRHAKPVVSSQVEIKLFPVAEDGDEFVLLASDGLWDVMSSQDVVSYVHQRFATELNKEHVQSSEDKENMKLVLRRNMARAVAREALRRGTGDNICVIIVWMQDLPSGNN